MGDAPSVDALDLPPELATLASSSQGLILVGGAGELGARSVVAALLAHVAAAGTRHIVSVESPLSWDLAQAGGLVLQRELGTDIRSAPNAIEKALRSALRSGADVIALCQLTEPRAIDQALVAAGSSALVIAAVPARGVVSSVAYLSRIVGPARHSAVVNAVSTCLLAAVSPVAVPLAAGGTAWAHDLMIVQKPTREALARGEWDSVEELMARGAPPHIRRLDDDLLRFARGGKVALEDALDAALDPRSLASAIE